MDDTLRDLFEHNWWANRRVVDTAAKLPMADWQRGLEVGGVSLRAALVHTYRAEVIWRLRLTGQDPTQARKIAPEQFGAAEDLANAWAAEEATWRSWLEGMPPTGLEVMYEPPAPLKPKAIRLYLLHVVQHGAQHRAEAALLLTEAGYSPGELDFLEYMLALGK